MGRYLELAKLIGVELGEFFEFKYEREVYLRVIKEDGVFDVRGFYDFNFINNYFNGYIEIIKYGHWINKLEEVVASIEVNIDDLNDIFTERISIARNLLKTSYEVKELITEMKEVKK